MEEKEFTVDELIDFLQELKGCGDYKVTIGGRPLFTDEWTLKHDKKIVNFRGNLYNEDIIKKANELQRGIEESIEKFYRK